MDENLLSGNGLGVSSAVTAIFADMPDCEDAFRVADADLDVGFFTDPTPLIDTLRISSRNVSGPGCVEWLTDFLKFIIHEVENSTIESLFVTHILRQYPVIDLVCNDHPPIAGMELFNVAGIKKIEAKPQP